MGNRAASSHVFASARLRCALSLAKFAASSAIAISVAPVSSLPNRWSVSRAAS